MFKTQTVESEEMRRLYLFQTERKKTYFQLHVFHLNKQHRYLTPDPHCICQSDCVPAKLLTNLTVYWCSDFCLHAYQL